MQIARFASHGCTVAQFNGRLDATAVPAADAALQAMVVTGPVVADLEQVGYVSSAGLRVLLKAAKTAQTAGHRFAVCGLQPSVREVFEISGFDRLIPAYPTLADISAAG